MQPCGVSVVNVPGLSAGPVSHGRSAPGNGAGTPHNNDAEKTRFRVYSCVQECQWYDAFSISLCLATARRPRTGPADHEDRATQQRRALAVENRWRRPEQGAKTRRSRARLACLSAAIGRPPMSRGRENVAASTTAMIDVQVSSDSQHVEGQSSGAVEAIRATRKLHNLIGAIGHAAGRKRVAPRAAIWSSLRRRTHPLARKRQAASYSRGAQPQDKPCVASCSDS